ncbi:NAD(P)/FAD-dependent oxidoreductase [Streptomyces subrutilus]|uniref:Nitrite reductase n=1 Tax=Streptomyces subrutilus TaxID=36818 RepID=A0A1E5PQT8_9ACTN|nr:FAD-dependent oxidoreductase [Streptomyces subrutilus]OEJ31909.1 nitrite reductase [Streptomyces subrutilus]
MTSKQRVVVIGGGLAGLRLAARLAGGAAVTVLGEEQHVPYNRVLLAEVLAGRYAPEVAALPAAGPELRRGVRAVRVDRADRKVHCDDGAALAYDTLVLATGSNPVLPPLRGLFEPEGRELPDGVHAFRTMDDCLALSEAVRPGVRAVVIGGGLLGVSAARALAARGAQVVLAQQAARLMERQLDAGASALLHAHLTALGVEIHTECRVRGLTTAPTAAARDARGHRRVTGAELADGYRLDADLVVLACGVRPRTGLAQAAGLEVRKGIVVDDRLRTSDPRIHAIGDCAEHAGQVYGLAGPALEQADVLAGVLTGADAAYAGTRALTRLTLTTAGGSGPFDLACFGETTPRPGDDVVRFADATRRTYRTVVLRDDRLVGGVLLGELSTVGAVARTWEGDEAPLDLFHLLTDDGGH